MTDLKVVDKAAVPQIVMPGTAMREEIPIDDKYLLLVSREDLMKSRVVNNIHANLNGMPCYNPKLKKNRANKKDQPHLSQYIGTGCK